MSEVLKKEAGRPTLYRQEMCEVVIEWVKEGIVNTEIAKRLGVSETTLYEWKDKYVEFAEAFTRAYEYRHQNVVNALYKRCVGYEYKETVVEDGKKTKEITKQMAPDPTSIAFYLTNRVPEEWRNRTDVNNNINISDPYPKTADMTEAEMIELIKTAAERLTIEALPTTTYTLEDEDND